MSDENRSVPKDLDDILAEADRLVQQQHAAASRARDYMDFLGDTADAFLQGFIDDVYARLDAFCTAARSMKILAVLNGYAKMDDLFFNNLEGRYGKTSQRVEKFRRFEFLTPPKAGQDIWTLKKSSHEAFLEILKLAAKEHKELIPHPIIAHLALLRLYVVSLLDKLEESDERGMPNPAVIAYVVYAVGVALKSMEVCWQTTDTKSLELMVKVGSRGVQLGQYTEKFSAVTDAAKIAWDHGCQLLHTQMLLLLKTNKLFDELEEANAKKLLRDCAPSLLVFGPGTKKILDACPCDKREGCPLVSRYGISKRILLPTSIRRKKSKP